LKTNNGVIPLHHVGKFPDKIVLDQVKVVVTVNGSKYCDEVLMFASLVYLNKQQ
jgi:hypothetical protein